MTHKSFIKGLFTYLVNYHGWKKLSKSEINNKNDSYLANVISYTYDDKTWELIHHIAWGSGYSKEYQKFTDYLILFEKPYPSSSNKVNFKLDNINYLYNNTVTWYVDRKISHPLNKKLQQEKFIDGCIADNAPVSAVYEKLADFYNIFIHSFTEFMQTHEYKKSLEYHIDLQEGRKLKDLKGKDKILCYKKGINVPCTPEEIIRQGIIKYLLDVSKVPKEHILVEEPLTEWESSSKGRIDILITYSDNGLIRPLTIIECKKGYKFPVDTSEILSQISHYSNELNSPPFAFTTNGTDIFSFDNNEFIPIKKFPTYTEMKKHIN